MKCENCDNEFPRRIKIDGIERDLGKRKQCLECSPFGSRNTKPVSRPQATTPQLDPIKPHRPQTKPKTVTPQLDPTTPQKLDRFGRPRHLYDVNDKYKCRLGHDHCIECGYEYSKEEMRNNTRICGECFWRKNGHEYILKFKRNNSNTCKICKRMGHDDTLIIYDKLNNLSYQFNIEYINNINSSFANYDILCLCCVKELELGYDNIVYTVIKEDMIEEDDLDIPW